jgi:hypothetical protein
MWNTGRLKNPLTCSLLTLNLQPITRIYTTSQVSRTKSLKSSSPTNLHISSSAQDVNCMVTLNHTVTDHICVWNAVVPTTLQPVQRAKKSLPDVGYVMEPTQRTIRAVHIITTYYRIKNPSEPNRKYSDSTQHQPPRLSLNQLLLRTATSLQPIGHMQQSHVAVRLETKKRRSVQCLRNSNRSFITSLNKTARLSIC